MSQEQRPEDAGPVMPSDGPGPDFEIGGGSYGQPASPSVPTAASPSAQPTPSTSADGGSQQYPPQPYPQQPVTPRPYAAQPPQSPSRPHAGQQYGGQPQPYGGGYGPTSLPEHPRSTTVLVLGILGFIFAIPAFFGWYMGAKAKKEINRGAPYRWDGSLKVGYILSIVASIISVGAILIYGLLLIAFFATFTTM